MTVLKPEGKQGDACNHPSRSSATEPPHRTKELHVAPMLDVTYSEFRYLIRLLTKRTVLWTEMIVDETIVHINSPETHLAIDHLEHPIVCQLGGNGKHPDWTRKAVSLICQAGYDEVNLNAGCPSCRVAGKEFGAMLMKQPRGVDQAIVMLQSMQEAINNTAAHENATPRNIPISIKTRIGVDKEEGLDTFLRPFVKRLIQEAGCRRFYMHARKVYTKGISPAQNRTIPPLDYPTVYRLCNEFPDCEFWINGGIETLEQAKAICYGESSSSSSTCSVDVSSNENDDGSSSENGCIPSEDEESSPPPKQQRQHGCIPCALCQFPNGSCVAPPASVAPSNLRGCLLGRAVRDNPTILANADTYFYGAPSDPSRNRRHVLEQYCDYLERRHPRQCCGGEEDDGSLRLRPGNCDVCGCQATVDGGVGDSSSTSSSSDAVLVDKKIENVDSRADIDSSTAKRKMKISSKTIDRCFKPVLGMFYGLPGAKKRWRRALDKYARDLRVRNCGPGFILRQAIECMPDELLDLPFTGEGEKKTYSPTDSYLLLHQGRPREGDNCTALSNSPTSPNKSQ